jgi:uncharacterized damage-inducible protein DinB
MGGRYHSDNNAARQRLQEVTDRLTDADLGHPVESGWTVRTVLVHMAFWDRFTLERVLQWEQSGFVWAPSNYEAINEAIDFLSDGVAPRAAIDLARAAAEQLDRKLEALSPELEDAIDTGERHFLLRRSEHRNQHLRQIERALGWTA